MTSDNDHVNSAVEALPVDEGLPSLIGRLFGDHARLEGLQRLSGGASQELWAFDVTTDGKTRELILRRNPGGTVKRETAASMEAEARLIQLAQETGTPVPEIVYVFTPEDKLGSGYLMARLGGETIARKILRDEEFEGARQKLAYQIGEAVAKIHAIPVEKAGDLRRSTIETSISSARELYQLNGKARPVVEWALRWLADNHPSEIETPGIVHGDLRNGNIIVGPEGLRAVLDWEVVHIGDPMEDLGWLCVTSWRFGEIDKPVGGLGSRADLFAGYEAVSGKPVDAERVKFWEVMGTLRWGLSCAMMGREFIEGDRSVEKAAIGRRASETEIDLLAILAPRGAYSHA